MPQLSDGLKRKIQANRSTFLVCMIAAFSWGLLAHAYVFLNSIISHDSLAEFNAVLLGNEFKIKSGRVFVPLYRAIARGPITLPWLIGLLSLVYLGLTVFFMVKYFNLHSKWMIVLTSGILIANVTVIATASVYLHDLDSDMLALLFAVLAAYLWKRYEKGYLYGMIPAALSLGFYQSYISTTITLIIFDLLLFLIDGNSFQDTFKRGLRSIVMLIGGGVLYFISVKAVCLLSGIALASGQYNSLDASASMGLSEWVITLIRSYLKVFYVFLAAQTALPSTLSAVIHLIIGCLICALGLGWMIATKKHWAEKLLAVALAAVLPFGMNISYILSGGTSHDLMHFAVWLFYLLPLLMIQHLWKRFDWSKRPILRRGALIPYCLVAVVLWGNVRLANGAYLQRELISNATQSLLTRIVYDMEHTEGYVPGETPVIFMQYPNLEPIPGFEANHFNGFYPDALGAATDLYYQAYFDYVLLTPVNIADYDVWERMYENEEVLAMPCYPAEGSIQFIDGNLVVRMIMPQEWETEHALLSQLLPD